MSHVLVEHFYLPDIQGTWKPIWEEAIGEHGSEVHKVCTYRVARER